MRKSIFFSFLFFSFLFFSFLFFSCSKESLTGNIGTQETTLTSAHTRTEGIPQEPTLENGILTFNNEEHFAAYLTYLAKGTPDFNEVDRNRTGFTSARKNFRSNPANEQSQLPIEDEYLSSVLNRDNVVIVKPWIFKLDAEQKKVFALRTNNMARLPLLLSGKPNSEIATFSFDDDVFYLLGGEGGSEAKNTDCSRTKTADGSIESWRTMATTISPDSKSKTDECIKAYFRYNGWGILKTLYINFYHAELSYKNSGTKEAPNWGSKSSKKVVVKHAYTDTWATHVKGSPIWASGSHTAEVSGGKLVIDDDVENSDFQSDWYVGGKCLATYKLDARVFFESSLKTNTVLDVDLGVIEGN